MSAYLSVAVRVLNRGGTESGGDVFGGGRGGRWSTECGRAQGPRSVPLGVVSLARKIEHCLHSTAQIVPHKVAHTEPRLERVCWHDVDEFVKSRRIERDLERGRGAHKLIHARLLDLGA